MIAWEIKKIFKSKTGLIVLGLFVFLCGVMSLIKPTLETENSYRNEKYELIVDRRPEKEIAQEKLNNKLSQIEAMANNQSDDEFSQKMIEISKEKLKAIKSREYEDVSFFKVFNHRVSHPFMSVIIVIILILIFSNIYTDERVSGVDNIILPSKNKFKALYAKLILAVNLPIVIYGIYLGIVFLITLIQYGTPVSGELGAFRIVDNAIFLNGAFTINEYLSLKFGIMILIFISIALFSSFFSFNSKNSLGSISGCLIFILLGKVCTLIKFLPNSLLMMLSKGNYVDLIFYPNQFIGMYFGNVDIFGMNLDLINLASQILVFIMFIGIALCVFTFKKVLTR
ncbi:hypothetical protein [Oceanirhabdus sp. W0125-5]|uniref:hypothetical protein n=1 Tax=Oceanirhabdus sp. W0125-5 TaxID=2999116 RepID=UPI0022F327BA|nr:hypothetical protein [Oceanirhabdus sp. W0125-5]WBW97766.1 hypothetical protein OW730_03005 [Oceanirhabdus sp. W0125-5]